MLTVTLANTFVVGLLAVLFVGVCALMTLIILIQKPKGGGLSGAFGGAGGGSSAVFGAKTGDILTWITVGFFCAFLVLGVMLVYATRSDATPATVVAPGPEDQTGQQTPGAPPAPGAEQPASLPEGTIDPESIPAVPRTGERTDPGDANVPQPDAEDAPAPPAPAKPEGQASEPKQPASETE